MYHQPGNKAMIRNIRKNIAKEIKKEIGNRQMKKMPQEELDNLIRLWYNKY